MIETTKIQIDTDSENLARSLGFSEEEVKEYLIKRLKPHFSGANTKKINAAKALDQIYNQMEDPLALRVFGAYSLGLMIGSKFNKGGLSPSSMNSSKIKRMLKEALEDFLEED